MTMDPHPATCFKSRGDPGSDRAFLGREVRKEHQETCSRNQHADQVHFTFRAEAELRLRQRVGAF